MSNEQEIETNDAISNWGVFSPEVSIVVARFLDEDFDSPESFVYNGVITYYLNDEPHQAIQIVTDIFSNSFLDVVSTLTESLSLIYENILDVVLIVDGETGDVIETLSLDELYDD